VGNRGINWSKTGSNPRYTEEKAVENGDKTNRKGVLSMERIEKNRISEERIQGIKGMKKRRMLRLAVALVEKENENSGINSAIRLLRTFYADSVLSHLLGLDFLRLLVEDENGSREIYREYAKFFEDYNLISIW